MRIYATCDIGEAALQRLRDRGAALEVHPDREAPPYEAVSGRVAAGIDGLLTTLRDRIDAPLLAAGAAHGLKVVAQVAVGVDNIDGPAAARHGIAVVHTPDVLTEATAEFALFLLGAVARRTWPSEQLVRTGAWATWHPYLPWLGDEVSGRTLAVVGTGRIGRSVVRKAVGLDMDVLCVGRSAPDPGFLHAVQALMDLAFASGLAPRRSRVEAVGLEDALRRADYVTLHVPLRRDGASPTHHLLDERRLRLMKPTAYLVNTSRGAVVDEGALVRALREGVLAGAALDVFETEPLPAESPLRDPALADRVRLFHHAGSAARATRLSPDPDVGMAGRAVQGLLDILDGADPRRHPWVANRDEPGLAS